MILGISALLLTIAGIVASMFALMSKELNKNRPLKYSIVAVLAFLALFAAAMSFYGFTQANNSLAPIAVPTETRPPFVLISTEPPAENLIPPSLTSVSTQIPITNTPTANPTITSTPPATAIAQQPIQSFPSPVATASSDCQYNNLIDCSIYIPFPERNANIEFDRNMIVNFNNQQIGSGVAFQFTPPLNVNGFPRVEVKGTSTTTFNFVIEYKLREGNGAPIKTSPQQVFLATSDTRAIQVPIIFNGEIDELVINFYEVGQSAIFTIESIRLMPQN